MRLFKPGRVALAGLGWGRADGGVWQPVPLALGGPGRGEPWTLGSEEEPELRELVELIAGARQGGRIAWSLARFEMGCERSTDLEALPDNMLALQSLLEADDDDAGRAGLSQRVAALCAEERDRPRLRRRLEAAAALERRAMAGTPVDLDLDEDEDAGSDAPRALCAEIEQHVRALLRDVVCGYLDADLRSVADDILIAGDEPIDIRAHDTRDEPEPEPEPEVDREEGLEPEPGPDHPAVNATARAPDGPGTAADPRSSAWAVAALPGPRTMREAPPPRVEDRVEEDERAFHDDDDLTIADEPLPADAQELDSGVTASADWDDDPASYSAPI